MQSGNVALSRTESMFRNRLDLIAQVNKPHLLQRLIQCLILPYRARSVQVSRCSVVDLWEATPAVYDVYENALPASSQNETFLIQPDIWRAGRDAYLYLLAKPTPDGVSQPWKIMLNLAALQRIALQDLQEMIAVQVAALKNDSVESVNKGGSSLMIDLLHKYTNGVRDLEYMQECAKRDFDRDPFLMMTSRELELQSMKRAGLVQDCWIHMLETPLDNGDPAVFASTPYRHHANQAAKKGLLLVRLFMALFGGFALIVPMLIMVLVPGQNVSLYVSSVFTIAAVVLAVGSDLDPDSVVGATAAYAAVLVVFVGASQPALQS